jgi:hypothetical protein
MDNLLNVDTGENKNAIYQHVIRRSRELQLTRVNHALRKTLLDYLNNFRESYQEQSNTGAI